MGIFSENLLYNVLIATITLTTAVFLYFKWCYGYWERVGLPTLTPTIPYGNFKSFITQKVNLAEQVTEFYQEFKAKGVKQGGGVYAIAKPFYIPTDPLIIKHILQNDFQHFINRGVYVNEDADPLSGHLFAINDSKWRNLRTKLTPTFTSGKMKMMFGTLVNCTNGLKEIIGDSANKQTPIDIKDILGRFTVDVIGSCAFGIDCNSIKDANAPFLYHGKRSFEHTPWEAFKDTLQFVVPHSILKFINYTLTKPDVEKFFLDLVKDTVNYRETNNVTRKDFMHLLLQLKNYGRLVDDDQILNKNGKSDDNNSHDGLTIEEICAQAFVFFLAGFETSSTLMTFALFELARNSDVQENLRNEINTVLNNNNGELTYEAVMEMHYLDKVLNETLRKYPPLGVLNRQCTKEYTVPNTTIRLEKGVDVGISVLGIHRDPDYYPNPEKFDPERFSEENKNTRPPFTFIPFGEGPRVCIGLRFGVMQSKVGLITIIKNFQISSSSKTKLPLKFRPDNFVLAADSGIWLTAEKLSNQ